MWSPIELHSAFAARCMLRASLTAELSRRAHFQVVAGRKIVNRWCDAARADETLTILEGYPAVYIGARHCHPIAPFCAFSIAEDGSIAHLECLIDYEPPDEGSRALGAATGIFMMMLFHDHPAIETVISPIAVGDGDLDGIEQVVEGDVFHIPRRTKGFWTESDG